METYLQIPFYPMPFYAVSMQMFKLSIFREKIWFHTVSHEYQGKKIQQNEIHKTAGKKFVLGSMANWIELKNSL